jgi:hypothetical protein
MKGCFRTVDILAILSRRILDSRDYDWERIIDFIINNYAGNWNDFDLARAQHELKKQFPYIAKISDIMNQKLNTHSNRLSDRVIQWSIKSVLNKHGKFVEVDSPGNCFFIDPYPTLSHPEYFEDDNVFDLTKSFKYRKRD